MKPRRKPYQAGEEITVRIGHDASMRFCWCPPGDFVFHDPDDADDAGLTSGRVKVIRMEGFWMAKTHVTQAQYQAVMGHNQASLNGDDHPVVGITYFQARDFVEKWNRTHEASLPGIMKLPSETQWEYARLSGGSPQSQKSNPCEHPPHPEEKTYAFGSRGCNAWGLHDIGSTVGEWTTEVFGRKYGSTDRIDEILMLAHRLVCGADWSFGEPPVQTQDRMWQQPGWSKTCISFRPIIQDSHAH